MGTVLLAVALPVTAAVLAPNDAPHGRDEPAPTMMLTILSVVGMAACLFAAFVGRVLLRRAVDGWERWLHSVSMRKYFVVTAVVPFALIFVGLTIAMTLLAASWSMGMVLLLVLSVTVASTAARFIEAEKQEAKQWDAWPTALPIAPAPRRDLRRAVARLEERMKPWEQPLTREQRDKAHWELREFGRALEEAERAAGRSRLVWMYQDRFRHSAGYILWISISASLALAWTLPLVATGEAVWITYTFPGVVALTATAIALTTWEVGYRHQRWLHRAVMAELAPRTEALRARVEELSAPARSRPSRSGATIH
ncbi:hypothetical protein [Streptomyces sp. NPDC048496]|uniref:hypothetical protein n=1 Tax=Streptomyces sp. NPDC048496 TaxID=3365558 RepID=UPI00371D0F95